MVNRFLDFLYEPLTGAAARAVLILTALVSHGYVLVTLLSIAAGGNAHPRAEHDGARHRTAAARPAPQRRDRGFAPARQDPQDRPGSTAARGVREELQTHRALQHVPYRGAGVAITLVGARHGRALLRVRGGDLATERRGWRRFLRRFDDDGGAYIPLFSASRGAAASGARRHLGQARPAVDHQVDHGVDHGVDQRVGLWVGVTSSWSRLNRRHTADCGLPIFERSLRHIEVGA